MKHISTTKDAKIKISIYKSVTDYNFHNGFANYLLKSGRDYNYIQELLADLIR